MKDLVKFMRELQLELTQGKGSVATNRGLFRKKRIMEKFRDCSSLMLKKGLHPSQLAKYPNQSTEDAIDRANNRVEYFAQRDFEKGSETGWLPTSKLDKQTIIRVGTHMESTSSIPNYVAANPSKEGLTQEAKREKAFDNSYRGKRNKWWKDTSTLKAECKESDSRLKALEQDLGIA
tara:strand:+ start:812 stop:1342 length:531 start_codon:yes stop_codon:yes gene_type:complete